MTEATPGRRQTIETPESSADPTAADPTKQQALYDWLRDNVGLSQQVIDKSRAKLSAEDVDSVEALQALHKLGGLSDVFSRVPALQVADALDALSPAGQGLASAPLFGSSGSALPFLAAWSTTSPSSPAEAPGAEAAAEAASASSSHLHSPASVGGGSLLSRADLAGTTSAAGAAVGAAAAGGAADDEWLRCLDGIRGGGGGVFATPLLAGLFEQLGARRSAPGGRGALPPPVSYRDVFGLHPSSESDRRWFKSSDGCT